MENFTLNNSPASRNEVHLLQEALRRACALSWNKNISESTLRAAIIAEAEKGTRDMHGLMRAVALVSQVA